MFSSLASSRHDCSVIASLSGIFLASCFLLTFDTALEDIENVIFVLYRHEKSVTANSCCLLWRNENANNNNNNNNNNNCTTRVYSVILILHLLAVFYKYYLHIIHT